jgi:cytochrome c-type biogenesis protein CcmH/NrfG
VRIVKRPKSLPTLILVFVAGFVAGVLFSAWKLENIAGRAQAPAQETSEQDMQQELRNRIAGIEKMLAVNPNNLEALTQLGNDYFDTGNFAKAVEAYQKALQLNPNQADVWTDLGVSYRRLNNPAESAKAFRKAQEINPGSAASLFNLGLVLRDDLKDPQGALHAWEKYLTQFPDSPHAVMVRPWVKQLKEAAPKAEEGSGSRDTPPPGR